MKEPVGNRSSRDAYLTKSVYSEGNGTSILVRVPLAQG
jgi:hypothetical protein